MGASRGAAAPGDELVVRAPVDQLARFDVDMAAVHLLLQPVCPRGHGSPSSASVWGMQRPRAELAEPRGQLAPRALLNSV